MKARFGGVAGGLTIGRKFGSLKIIDAMDSGMTEKSESIFRLQTSCWHDQRSLHVKRSLTRLKRLSSGDYEHILDEAVNIGAYDAVEMITNLSECKDGVYKAVVIDEQTDWETGFVEDWRYKLVPVEPSTGVEIPENSTTVSPVTPAD